MSTYRSARTARSRTGLLAATGITLATLALTACQDGTGTKDEGASQPATASAAAEDSDTHADPGKAPKTTATGTGTGTGSGTGTGGGTGTGTETGTGKGTGTGTGEKTRPTDPHAPENRVICNGSNTTVTAQPVPRPLNHLLLTVKNTGSKTCDLTYYPVLRFGEMQWVPQPFEESKPQAVTTLAPGESGYAGVLLASADGSGDGGTTGRKLTVGFHGRTPGSGGGPAATPSLPARGVYYDSSLSVTYWLSSAAEALRF
ncbi:DUF4232 domain-containing protein [Streptomyces bullii]|uniref:DUF4232 domain-containing protein n=1 Tax=Streptomyces bullii TaxID=349910 RepID=A0ABW0UWW3_9ACTN